MGRVVGIVLREVGPEGLRGAGLRVITSVPTTLLTNEQRIFGERRKLACKYH